MNNYLNQLGNQFLFLEELLNMPMWSFTPHLWFFVVIVRLLHNGITVLNGLAVIIGFVVYQLVLNLFQQSYDRQHYINPLLDPARYSLSLFFTMGFVFNTISCFLELFWPLLYPSASINWFRIGTSCAEMLSTILLFANTQGPIEKRKIYYAIQN